MVKYIHIYINLPLKYFLDPCRIRGARFSRMSVRDPYLRHICLESSEAMNKRKEKKNENFKPYKFKRNID